MQNEDSLEREVECTGSTLTGLVEKLQANKYARYVVMSHGEPTAVVMAFEPYSVLKRTFQHVIRAEARLNQVEAVHAAFDEMAEEYWPEVKGRSREVCRAVAKAGV